VQSQILRLCNACSGHRQAAPGDGVERTQGDECSPRRMAVLVGAHRPPYRLIEAITPKLREGALLKNPLPKVHPRFLDLHVEVVSRSCAGSGIA